MGMQLDGWTLEPRPHVEPPSEHLVCPGCRLDFDFGRECPDCGELLVGASLVGVASAQPRDAGLDLDRALQRVALLVSLVLLLPLVLALLRLLVTSGQVL